MKEAIYWIIIGLMIAALIYALFFKEPEIRSVPGRERLIIKTNEIVQYRYLQPVSPGQAAADPARFLAELNSYRTNPGWIRVSNEWILAGLMAREWRVPFQVIDYPNAISVEGGAGIAGITYTRDLSPRWQAGGGIRMIGDKAQPVVKVGWRW